jgi:hypothetical protein
MFVAPSHFASSPTRVKTVMLLQCNVEPYSTNTSHREKAVGTGAVDGGDGHKLCSGTLQRVLEL